jgi:transcriptional regulator with XRE-family HTH domain
MKFGEKVRKLRQEKGLTQKELAQKAGLGLKTITNYESGSTYPRSRRVYEILAGILGCKVEYLNGEGGDFIAQAQAEFGYRGKKGAQKLMEELTGLFAGGEMAEEDMDELMYAVQEAYVLAKRKNKKYTPKRYRKPERPENG